MPAEKASLMMVLSACATQYKWSEHAVLLKANPFQCCSTVNCQTNFLAVFLKEKSSCSIKMCTVLLGTLWLLQFQASMRSSIIELISAFFLSQLLLSCQHQGTFNLEPPNGSTPEFWRAGTSMSSWYWKITRGTCSGSVSRRKGKGLNSITAQFLALRQTLVFSAVWLHTGIPRDDCEACPAFSVMVLRGVRVCLKGLH